MMKRTSRKTESTFATVMIAISVIAILRRNSERIVWWIRSSSQWITISAQRRMRMRAGTSQRTTAATVWCAPKMNWSGSLANRIAATSDASAGSQGIFHGTNSGRWWPESCDSSITLEPSDQSGRPGRSPTGLPVRRSRRTKYQLAARKYLARSTVEERPSLEDIAASACSFVEQRPPPHGRPVGS